MNKVDQLLLGTLRLVHRWQFGFKLRLHAAEEGRLAYLKSTPHKERPTLVFLHGLGASKDQWGTAVMSMARDYECVLVDLPGHGESVYESVSGFGPQSLMSALEGFLETVVKGPLVLIGSSLGGCVAGLYAAKYPQRVSHLILLSPAGLGMKSLGPILQARLQRGQTGFGYRTVREMQRFWGLVYKRPPKVRSRWAQAMAASGKSRFNAVQRITNDFRREGLDVLLERLPYIVSITLVIWGRHDQVFLHGTLDVMLEDLPNARGLIIEDSGHAAYLERGREVTAAITEFISTTH